MFLKKKKQRNFICRFEKRGLYKNNKEKQHVPSQEFFFR